MSGKSNQYPWYSPRFWHGMRAGHYFRLLARNRFRIGFMGIGMSFMIIWFSMANSLAWRLQQLLFGQKI
ncbi:MAG: sulfotransferase, partial [Planctomycetota bacterium]|nr:sulfotransferase [Planctomycetota bacterium]